MVPVVPQWRVGEIMVGRLSFVEHCMVRALCTLALLFVGFAHKPAMAAPWLPAATELAQYVLPDGTLPVLCLSSEHGKASHDGQDKGSGCEACRLSASVLLPVPQAGALEPILREIARSMPLRAEAHHRQLFPPNTAPRGPPSAPQA